ncbi:MAG: protein translocase subunit SecD [Candidatus Nanopelagicales bacterium]|nr:protein translocase subunit SecD [Candidatus Nanopelagicales bacterium]MDZ4249161.1 protein translocase subunit SecD [Candidatus Nanopelagicales bacterium]
MAAPAHYRPGRVLGALAIFVVALTVWAMFPGTDHAPQLGLDLRGGTQVILAPEPIREGDQITDQQLEQSVEIIRARVNGIGVAEADVSVQGSGNDAVIVVSVPGVTQDRIVDLVGRTALLDFRAVQGIGAPEPGGVETDDTDKGKKNKGKKDKANKTTKSASATPPSQDRQGTQIVQAAEPNETFLKGVAALNCTTPENQAGGTADDPELWLGTCDRDGAAKYILQPAFIRGTNVTSAQAELPQQGAGGWLVTLNFDSEGAAKLAEISKAIYQKPSPQNQFAIVLDGVVVSAPSFREPIPGGTAQIEGNFSAQEARDLANVLNYGALPVTLENQAVESISPTLGSDQLQKGLLAGALGLVLVALYLLFYYRALGIVAGVSLLVAGWITYASFVVLGRSIGYTLTLAGIAGAIVAIGITADSFVVYFERLRDEIRMGKSLRRAADDGWIRARRTLLAADFVSFLAAAVLYWLSVGNVRGFAFALGLTTLVDVLVAFWFTRPIVSVMARSKWMQRGSSLSGVSPSRLGAETLAGRQRPTTRSSKAKAHAGRTSEPAGEV